MKQFAALMVLTLGGCASGSETASAPADPTSEKALTELILKLDEQAAHRAGFTAIYRVRSSDSELTLRFSYRAPDHARLDASDGTTKSTAWVIGDRNTCHVDSEDGAQYAVAEPRALQQTWMEFDAALDAAFPVAAITQRHGVELGYGPTFDLRVRPDSESLEDGSLDTSVAWLGEREWFLGWLSRASSLKNVRLEGVHLRGNGSDGTHVSISTETGFLEEASLGEHLRVELVEFRDQADESEFVIPDPSPGAKDVSEQYAMMGLVKMFLTKRDVAIRRIETSARSEPPDDLAFRKRVTHLFDLLHRVYARTRFAADFQELTTTMDDMAMKAAAVLHLASRDPSAPRSAEQKAAFLRSDFESTLGEWMSAATNGLSAMEPAEGDPAQLASIAKSENEMIAQAVRSEFVEPLLRRYDDALKRALDQR